MRRFVQLTERRSTRSGVRRERVLKQPHFVTTEDVRDIELMSFRLGRRRDFVSETTVRAEIPHGGFKIAVLDQCSVIQLPAETHTEPNRSFPKIRLDIFAVDCIISALIHFLYENISPAFAVDYFRLCLRIFGFGPASFCHHEILRYDCCDRHLDQPGCHHNPRRHFPGSYYQDTESA